MTSGNDWIHTRERGASWTIALMIALCRRRYRWLVELLLYPITGYFYVTGRRAHRASRQFFRLATGQTRRGDYYRQLLNFSRCLADRVAILSGDGDRFQIRHSGREALLAAQQQGRGLILLGSHLGSFEACKLLASDRMQMNIHIVAYFAGSTKNRDALDAINPALRDNFIDPTEADAVFRMRDVIDSGGVLAILGDRTGIGDKHAQVDFLGQPAWLPTGPWYLAAILHCPVFCFFGLRTGNYAYDTYAFPLAERVTLARGQRQQQAQAYAQRYADLLADMARKYPDNWFNFHRFWDPPVPTIAASPPSVSLKSGALLPIAGKSALV
jgi:predicted LPLAT superfamily acyltransferase